MAKRISVGVCMLILISIPILFVCSDSNGAVYSSISGKVISEDTGQGVSGVSVLAGDVSRGSQTHYYAKTDINGLYVLRDLVPGTYKISFKKADSVYLFGFEDITITLPVGKNVVAANYVLKLGGSVSGAVYDSDGVTPLSNVWVSAQFEDSQLDRLYGFSAKLTAGDGRFFLQGLPQSDRCIVQVNIPGYAVLSKKVNITGGSTTQNVNFVLKREDITGVTGRVTSSLDGKAIKDAEVVLRDLSGNDIGNAYTDATGKYSITGVPPGVYTATVYWPTGEFDSLHKGNITITRGTQIPIDFQFNAPSPQSKGTNWMKNMFAGLFISNAHAGIWSPEYPDPKFHGCSASEKDNIKRGFNRIKQWLKFDPCIGPAMRERLKAKLADGIRFFCVSSADLNECTNMWGFTYDDVEDIYLCRDKSLSDITPEWCLESTILHELVHSVGYPGEETPMKCDKACFSNCKAVQVPAYDPYKGCKCE